MVKAIILDRDGTVIKEKDYLSDPEKIEFEDTAIDALQALLNNGYKLFMVTNQSGIARGYFSETQLKSVQDRLFELLKENNITFTDFRYCPHHPTEGTTELTQTCACRKPEPGMLIDLIKNHDIDISKSYMIGDKLADIEAGKLAGVSTVLVRTGYGATTSLTAKDYPDYTAKNLMDAVENFIT